MSDLKVGQSFVRCYPEYMWGFKHAKVGIEYTEYEIVKVNKKSFRVAKINKEGIIERSYNWKNEDDGFYPTKEDIQIKVLENTPAIIKQYERSIAKYTERAFSYWYLKAQKRMVELIYDLAVNGKLNYWGVESVSDKIKNENNLLNTKLKELECEKE
jgi:hypothetical protein